MARPRLTRIDAIRALSPDEAAKGYPVRIRGTVTYLDESWPSGLIVHDGRSGQFVLYAEPYIRTHPRIDLRVGDLVEVEGHTARGGFAPNVDPSLVRKLGRGSLPPPKHLPYTALQTGRHDCDYVEITGVGQRAWLVEPPAAGLFLEVAVEGGTVRASMQDATPEDVDRFVDARLRLQGNVGALFGRAGQLRGVSLLTVRAAVVVVEPPPDPFTLPSRPVSSLYRYSREGEVNRRIRLRGVVTGQRIGDSVEVRDFTSNMRFRDVRHVLFLRDETGAARIETAQDTRLAPGDLVDVAGFPAVTSTKPILRNAIVRRLESGPKPPFLPLPPEQALDPEKDAELVQAQARLLGVVAGPAEGRLVLQLGETPFEAVLDAAEAEKIGELRTGSQLAVTGVYSYQWGPPPSFRLLLRSASDVVLTAAAPWWTSRHSAVMLVIVILMGSAAALWVRMITNRNQLVRERYRAILAERSRLARELHDTLEQGLAGINLQLEAVGGSLVASPEASRRSLDVAREMLRYSMEEARRTVMDLRLQALESRDLAGALSDLTRRMTAGTPLQAEVRVVGSRRPLDAPQQHHLFRIGVEAITNAVKHSQATRIEVELRFDAEAVQLTVSDDGSGFTHSTNGIPGEHFGMRGIRDRVDKLGGVLSLDEPPGGGTTLVVAVPLRAPSPPEPGVDDG